MRQTNNLVLKADIDMSDYTWTGEHNYCAGRIYGEGHRIYNLHGNCKSFLTFVNNADIRDFELNVNFSSSDIKSPFIYRTEHLVLIENVNVTGSVRSSGHCDIFGGIVASTGSGAKRDASYGNDQSVGG